MTSTGARDCGCIRLVPSPSHPPRSPDFGCALPDAENDAGLESEVALVVIAGCKCTVKSRQNVIELGDSDVDIVVDWYVKPAADNKVESVVARGGDGLTDALTGLEQVAVNVRVRSTEHGFDKRFIVFRPVFQDGTDVVSEHIAACNDAASRWA